MRTLTNGTLIVQAYDAHVWLQERNVLRIQDTGATKVSVGLNPTQGFATYTLDANHEAVVDMSDYIRTHATATDIYVRSNSGVLVYVNANYIPVGLINPANVIIPETDIAFQALVSFPSFYLQAINGVNTSFEMRGFPTGSGWEAGGYGGEFVNGTNVLPYNVVSFNYGSSQGFGYFSLHLVECEKRYASVRWQSFSGATKCHTWELRDATNAADEVIRLETVDGSYNQIKGRTDGFKLYLDELNAYDYWYYSDIITSSKVDVSLDGITWNQVDVTTKSVTIPNTSEGKTNKLEIAVNWRKYDAVTM